MCSWADCSDIFELIADVHDIAHVSCLPSWPPQVGYPANIVKIATKRQDLPDSVYINGDICSVKPYISPSRQCQNRLRFRHPTKCCKSMHVVLSVPHLAIPVQTALQQYIFVQTAPKNIMFYSEAVQYWTASE